MTSRLVLQGIDLKAGAFRLTINLDEQLGALGIFGPSGAGKTTLLELIAGLRRPQSGRVQLDGHELTDMSSRLWIPAWQREIGYVPQDLALFSHLNVRDNIGYGVSRHRGPAADRSYDLDAILALLELAPLLDRRPDSLSGGEKQRVAVARALAARPKVLLLDEPLTSLDQDRKDSVLHYLQKLRRGWNVPMIYVSHQADEIAALCDAMVVLRHGRIERRGSPLDLLEKSARPAYRLREGLGTSLERRHVEE